MKCDDIYKTIILILKNRFHFQDELFEGDVLNLPLCGIHFQMNTTEMVYLFFEVERTFQIHITDRILQEYGFHSIREIGDCVLCASKALV